MAAVIFAYDHSRDPMNPNHLGLLISNALNLTSQPVVDINPTQIIVTHPNVSEANRAAIQSLIDGYVFDAALVNGVQGALQQKATAAIQTNIDALALPDPTAGNNTFLAISSPTNAQTLAQVKALTNQNNALVAQVRALTRQNTALIRLALGLLGTTSGT